MLLREALEPEKWCKVDSFVLLPGPAKLVCIAEECNVLRGDWCAGGMHSNRLPSGPRCPNASGCGDAL
jgi:hypothetical protein